MSFISTENLYEEIVLVASNDGDAYRDNKNAERAVDDAIRDTRRRIERELRGDMRDLRKRAVSEVREGWREENPCKCMVIPNPTGNAVAAIHVKAKNDPNGNPQRLFMVIADDGRVIDVIDEGYEGDAAVLRKYKNLQHIIPINLKQGEYRRILRSWERTKGREYNPAFTISEPVRASIGAAIGGGLGALGTPWTAVVLAAVGSLIGSNWKKLTAGAKAGTSAYRETARANNPGPSSAELVSRLKF